ncbi:hypothetical protein GQ457_02G012560 [Hibiscus cannabinus]
MKDESDGKWEPFVSTIKTWALGRVWLCNLYGGLMAFLWIPPSFDKDSILPASVVTLLWAFKRFQKEVILEKVVLLRLLLRFFQFCDQWIWSVGAAELVSWSYVGMKVNSFDGKMVCLSLMKKDLPRIKTIGCLKYGSWMIRPVLMFEAGACLLLELSPRSCLKFKTYGFRSCSVCPGTME